jgi:hypothetical protein
MWGCTNRATKSTIKECKMHAIELTDWRGFVRRFESPWIWPPQARGNYVVARMAFGLLDMTQGQPYRVMYIGRSSDLSVRVGTDLRQHHRYSDFVHHGCDIIMVRPCGLWEDEKAIEADLISTLSPPLNVQMNALSDYLRT